MTEPGGFVLGRRTEEMFFVGRAIDEYKLEPGRGDFLIRQVVGVDQRSGALAGGSD